MGCYAPVTRCMFGPAAGGGEASAGDERSNRAGLMTTLRVAARSLSIRASHDQLLQTRGRARERGRRGKGEASSVRL